MCRKKLARLRRSLAESEERFRALVALSSDWYWEQDAEYRFTRVEGGTVDPGALRPGQIVGRRAWELGLQEVSESQMREHRATLERREPFADFVYRIDGPDGRPRWSSVSGEPVFGPDRRFLGYRGTARNITAQVLAERRLFAEKERAQATLQAIGDAVIVTDVRGFIEFMNPIAEKLTGCDLLKAAGAHVAGLLNLVDENTGAQVQDPVSRVLASGGIVAEGDGVILAGADGARHALEYSAAPIRNGRQEMDGAVIAFRDVTRQREMAEQVSWQASHDALTGLINRREFERRVEQALAGVRKHGGQHALLFLDLDQFKVVNDTCGHAAGDELLRQLTHALSGRIRQSDTLARLGGDEFGVLLERCPIEQAHRVAEALRMVVEDFQFVWQDKIFKVGVSIGGVPIADPAKTLASLMSAADSACYFAKDSGRNRVHLATGEDGELAERHGQMEWVSRIHKALNEERFRLWFQEIRPVGGRDACGDHYELLMRMVDEEGRPVPPMAFIPAAERYDLMPAIDRWVVRTAFAFIERAHAPGARSLGCASINLSGASIGDPNFLAFVQSELAARRLDPRAICFEITETAAIANLTRAAHFIAELKAKGFRFSLDDFGSGMSSFAYLKNLPVDFLKIDGSFVKDMHRDPIDRAMVEAIHRVGHVMGLATIAEFVESDEILACLREIGVDYAQGYGVARPRPLEELALGGEPRPEDRRERVDPLGRLVQAGNQPQLAAA